MEATYFLLFKQQGSYRECWQFLASQFLLEVDYNYRDLALPIHLPNFILNDL